jgi:hypothetical protein
MSTPSIVDRMSATDVRKPPIAESDGDREAVVSVLLHIARCPVLVVPPAS